jgi:hypothetical protein
MDDEQRTNVSPDQASGEQNGPTRRYGATRVRPRVEFGRRDQLSQANPGSGSLIPEVVERDTSGNELGGEGGPDLPYGTGDMFGGREFAGGRVRVYGCSPGCLMMSLVISIILTLLLNAIF